MLKLCVAWTSGKLTIRTALVCFLLAGILVADVGTAAATSTERRRLVNYEGSTSQGGRFCATVDRPATGRNAITRIAFKGLEVPCEGGAHHICDLPEEGHGSLSITRALQRPGSGQALGLVEPKTANAHRRFAIPPALVAFLRRHRAEQRRRLLQLGTERQWPGADLVCDRGDGGPLDPDGLTHAARRLGKEAGLPPTFTLHQLQHSAATTLLEAGVQLKIASAILGHSSSSFTADAYQHVLEKTTEAGADALGAAYGTDGRSS